MKRVIPAISIIIVAFVGSGFFLFTRYDSMYFMDLISDVLNKSTGANVQFASSPSLTIMPLGIEFGKVQWQKEIIESTGNIQNIQVSADGGFLSLALSKFILGKILLRDARVDNLRIEIIEKEGTHSQHSKDYHVASGNDSSGTELLKNKDVTSGFPLEMVRLHVRHGTFIHHSIDGTQTRFGGVDIVLENLSINGMAGLHCNFDCSVEAKNGDIVLAGDMRIDGNFRYEEHLVNFLDSVLMFSPKIGPLPAKAGPLRLDFAGNHDFSTNRLHLQQMTVSLGLSGVKGGKVSAKGQAAADFSNLQYTVKAVAGGLPIGAMFEAFGYAHGFDATGAIDVDLAARGSDTTSVFSSLEGRGNIELRGILPVIDNKLAKSTGKIGVPLPNKIDRLFAPFIVKNGDFLAKPVTMSGNGFSGNGRANISLPSQNINASMDCKFMGVTVPVYAKGSFSNIQWGIDQNFAARLPGNLADVLSGTGKKAGDAGSILFRKGRTAGGNLLKKE